MSNKVETLYNTKIIQAGNRLTIIKYDGLLKQGGEARNKKGRKGRDDLDCETKEENKKASRKQVLNKARNNIINCINCNSDMNTFITLTYKENMQDLKLSKEHLKYFFKKLGQDYKGLKYLYVLEFQERGAIHYHMLCNINTGIKGKRERYKKSYEQKLYEQEFSDKYWKRGFVDVQLLKDDGIRKVGNYIASYLVEDLFDIDLQGGRVWGHSRNLDKPLVSKILTDIKACDLAETGEGIELLYKSMYERSYVAKNGKEYKSKVRLYSYELKE